MNYVQTYQYCSCVLFIYYKLSEFLEEKKYILLTKDENTKLSNYKYNNLYIIKRDAICDCQLKEYINYMGRSKIDLIMDLKNLKEFCRNLT